MMLIGDDAHGESAKTGRAANDGLPEFGLVLVERAGVDQAVDHIPHFIVFLRVGID